MQWTSILGIVLSPIMAMLGAIYGARRTTVRDVGNWKRDQRFKVYAELLAAVWKRQAAFEELFYCAEVGREACMTGSQREKALDAIREWRAWDKEITRVRPSVVLVRSEEITPAVELCLLGTAPHAAELADAIERMLTDGDIPKGADWEDSVGLSARLAQNLTDALKGDLTRFDPVPGPWKRLRRAQQGLALARESRRYNRSVQLKVD